MLLWICCVELLALSVENTVVEGRLKGTMNAISLKRGRMKSGRNTNTYLRNHV